VDGRIDVQMMVAIRRMMPTMMSLSEAKGLLGLPDGPDAPLPDALSLRKAYVRAIKRDGPESNPQAFQRVRAAWERLALALEESRFGDDGGPAHAPQAPSFFTPTAAEMALPSVDNLSFVVSELDVALAESTPPDGARETIERSGWVRREDELIAHLCTLGTFAPGPRVSVNDASELAGRLVALTRGGWTAALDAPVTRTVARLYELGHPVEAHQIFEGLWQLRGSAPQGREPMSARQRERVRRLRGDLTVHAGSPSFDWLFEVECDAPEASAAPVWVPAPRRKRDSDDVGYGDFVAIGVVVIVGLFALLWLGYWTGP
jgi:hypothetical protein